MNHPLASLVGPLRYACQRDFAMLATVKGLRPVLEHALAGARGVDARALEHLHAALPEVDDPSPERRKAALRRVVAGLKLSGVVLPVELEGVAAAPVATPPGYVPPWKSMEPLPTSTKGRAPGDAPAVGAKPGAASASSASRAPAGMPGPHAGNATPGEGPRQGL
ncbi:DNA helicase RecG, partial [Pyxidicoccus sp. 3LG]